MKLNNLIIVKKSKHNNDCACVSCDLEARGRNNPAIVTGKCDSCKKIKKVNSAKECFDCYLDWLK